ncbi:FadR family transcriptional regulator (plasmid) [Skermanella sp. TT6]|uniref:FadR family transcriptional regulator n=1 Tax=Skermanella cutis TaxID=2775420 RepID=A0ABX7BF31_9PROT|nr:FCD domain-containing protein [Skermanella sp. TT6]QQP92992.1 FadR family transcriptional regulator [Skermanella sp. TT6]
MSTQDIRTQNIRPQNVRTKAATGASALVQLIESNIAEGVWSAGFKLPAERDLEKQFGVSRNTLRKSLKLLQDKGSIIRHVGRGSFVAPPPSGAGTSPGEPAASDSLVRRIHGASPAEIMEVRLVIEPAAVELAAVRANAEDFHRIRECLARSEAAPDIGDFEHWDGQLHVSIVTASKNSLLIDLYRTMNETRNQPEWLRLKRRSLTPERRGIYQDQHRRIVAALTDRDAQAARSELLGHLLMVRSNLLGPTGS